MSKVEKHPGTALAPVPVVMVSCAAPGYRPNIITLAWVGTVCSDPPMLSISIRPERHSHAIVTASREFVVNIPNQRLLQATDYCGVASGRDVDKFAETGLTMVPGHLVQAPLIVEAPVNIECRVSRIVSLGSHDLFIGEILTVHLDEAIYDAQGLVDLEKMAAITYGGGRYYQVGALLGRHGLSERKPRE